MKFGRNTNKRKKRTNLTTDPSSAIAKARAYKSVTLINYAPAHTHKKAAATRKKYGRLETPGSFRRPRLSRIFLTTHPSGAEFSTAFTVKLRSFWGSAFPGPGFSSFSTHICVIAPRPRLFAFSSFPTVSSHCLCYRWPFSFAPNLFVPLWKWKPFRRRPAPAVSAFSFALFDLGRK